MKLSRQFVNGVFVGAVLMFSFLNCMYTFSHGTPARIIPTLTASPTETYIVVFTVSPTSHPTLSPKEASSIIQTKISNYTSTPNLVSPTMFCYSQYPDFCISKYVPCKDLGQHNFSVLHPDPLNYDRDNDGVGCEQ